MDIPFATFTSVQIKLKIGISGGSLMDMFKRQRRQWRTAKIGMKNYPCGIDDRTQRISQALSQLPFYSGRNSGKSKINSRGIEPPCRNLLTESGQYRASGICDGGRSILREKRGHIGCAYHFIYG